jgi:DNA-binding MurR/RpiR family transcriptional regulator
MVRTSHATVAKFSHCCEHRWELPERAASLDYEALYGAINTARQAQSLSWRDLADLIGTSPSTFTRLAQGQGMDAATFAALIAWLRMDANEFILRRTSAVRRQRTSASTLATISGHLRADKNLDRDAARHLDSIIASAYKALTATKKKRADRAARLQE